MQIKAIVNTAEHFHQEDKAGITTTKSSIHHLPKTTVDPHINRLGQVSCCLEASDADYESVLTSNMFGNGSPTPWIIGFFVKFVVHFFREKVEVPKYHRAALLNIYHMGRGKLGNNSVSIILVLCMMLWQ